ncbi:MAG TPA: YbaB/EbfC family DNA-binding protein [Firmicutes bacterium]|nr:MAG: hypothetical protein DRP67_04065 [Candidatus Omnitrophota bacterium]HDD64734.1 YbaB/EbfC family DNA-binding protein [Bacillota bacterium]
MAGIFDTLKQLSELRKQAAQFQKLLLNKIVEVSSPGNEIKIKVNGKMEILNLEFSPEVLKPEKKEYLERLFIKTWANAQKEVEKLIRKEIKMQLPNIPF